MRVDIQVELDRGFLLIAVPMCRICGQCLVWEGLVCERGDDERQRYEEKLRR